MSAVSVVAIDSRPRPLAAANWKMNGLREDGRALALGLAERAARRTPACEVVVCPPATLLAQS
ncbi:MAG: hypothetical protein FJX53_15570, partial [Alphaproteobacteria bacterium]|nr:hypothetical protein [Alphaproteobacteria bacterium]